MAGGLFAALVAFAIYTASPLSEGYFIDYVTKRPTSGVSLLFVGDIMFDRYIRDIGERRDYSYILASTTEYLRKFDAVVGNLEGPITSYGSVSQGTKHVDDPGHMQFTFDTKIIPLLKENNFGLVSLGNNHIADFGRDGYEQTKQYLDDDGLEWVGGPYGDDTDTRYMEFQDITIAFISFNQFLGGSVKKTSDRIQAASRESDVVIVLAHWGEEYLLEPEPYVTQWAHTFIDAGASVIIGSHPHVIETVEEYGGGKIYYSLGNFVFDQYWEESVRCGLGVELTMTKHSKDDVRLSYAHSYFGRDNTGKTFVGCQAPQ